MEKSEEIIIEERKKKFFGFLKKSQIWVIAALVILIILGIYIRSLPMQDHGGTPGLWDIATKNWTLGPDLDPWLFLRNAKYIVETGTFPKIDLMRNVPLGFDNSKETMLLPYMIDWTYHTSKIFYSGTNIEFAGAIFPVVMFFLTIISFFFFVREIFMKKENKNKANIIGIIAALFMIVIPVFLSRTVAGIPEKESAAFFFMFLSFFLFLKAWKSEKIKGSAVFGILAGISTGIMSLIWGGVMFVYIPVAGATLISFVLNKVTKKEFIAYSLWFLISILIVLVIPTRYNLVRILTSLSSGFAFLVLMIILVHFILLKIKIFENEKFKKLKFSHIPKPIISLAIAVIVILLVTLIFLGPAFIVEKVKTIHQSVFHPVTGRWNTTVAENRQPDFKEWGSSFGPFLKGIPIMFWLFFAGSVFLFYQIFLEINKKERLIITGAYLLLLLGMIFTRYSNSSIFNGENLLSKVAYYGAVLIFIIVFVYYYINDHKAEKKFENVKYSYILLFCLFLMAIFSARGAVRLIMVLGPIASIFASYLIVESSESFIKTKDPSKKIGVGVICLLVLAAGIFTFTGFYKEIKSSSYNMVPSVYNQQWQKSMSWVRENTEQNSVFGSWWDYGYWIQSIGERATVLDGGNAITFWNYYMGRLVLTGDNEKDALDFLYSHNTTHFLIDSTDIAKYGAFSGIGSDKNYDRYSWIGTLLQDESQMIETNNETIYVYPGGFPLDEDLIISENGKEIFLPGGKSAIVGAVVRINTQNGKEEIMQPYVVVFYQNQQHNINLRYIRMNGVFIDFKTGIEATAFVFPKLVQSSQGIQVKPFGAMMYLSPRLMKGMLSQKYILDDPFKKFQHFKLLHKQDSYITETLKTYGLSSEDFVYFQGVQGPIKIWEIEYTGQETFKQEYLDKDSSKYLSWEL